MSKENNEKELFLSLYNQLTYDYQLIVLNTFKCLATYNDLPEKGYKPYAISDVIAYYQNKKNYTNQDVCDKASELVSTTENYISLTIDRYTKNKQRNSQSYKKGINWLNVIAEVLDFAYEEYHKYSTDNK